MGGWWPSSEEEQREELSFDASRDPGWAKQVDEWPWIERDEETAAKTGACPRCGHHMSVVDTAAVHARMVLADGGEKPRRYAACNCGVKHADTPEGESGCGANGLIERA